MKNLISLTIHNLTKAECEDVQKYALELVKSNDVLSLTKAKDSCDNVLNLIDCKIKLDIKRFEKGRL